MDNDKTVEIGGQVFPVEILVDAVKDGGERMALIMTEQAEGAIPNGTRIVKVRADREGQDSISLGGQGVVIGSVGPITDASIGADNEYGYFIEWDGYPGYPVMTRGYKIEPVA